MPGQSREHSVYVFFFTCFSPKNGFFRGFLFLSRRIFLRTLLSPEFFLSFLGKSAKKNPPGKPRQNPDKLRPNFLKEVRGGGWPEGGPGSKEGRGHGSWCSSACKGVKKAWEYHEPGTPHDPSPRIFP